MTRPSDQRIFEEWKRDDITMHANDFLSGIGTQGLEKESRYHFVTLARDSSEELLSLDEDDSDGDEY